MRFRSPGFRRLAFVVAAVQFAAAGLTALAHAQAEVGDAAVAHVEATTSASCPVVHPVDCGVCRHASDAQLPSSVVAQSFAASTAAESRAPERPASDRVLDGLYDGRAPPVA